MYPLPAYQQYSTYQRDIFLGTEIWTDRYVKRYGSMLYIEPPKHFQIRTIYLNSEDYGIFTVENCLAGCMINVGYGRVTGVAYNEWNALGLFYYPLLQRPPAVEDPYIGWTMLAVGLLTGFVVLMLLRYLRRETGRM